jgi:DNA helicase HerA-like ATPase
MNPQIKRAIEIPESPFIGYVVSGGLKENLQVRLTVPTQQVQEGSFLVAESGDWQFYGIITDMMLGATDPRFADEQNEERLPAMLAELLHGQTLYTNLTMLPALMLEKGPEPGTPQYEEWVNKISKEPQTEPRPMPIKTIPSHHAKVRLAGAGDVAEIFGDPIKRSNFILGYTREQNHPVCVNLEKLVMRSSGIFGATGSGKSFLARILLAGLIHYDAASVLVFDMHNEYGFEDTATDTGKMVVGLKNKFASKVQVVGLGRDSFIRGRKPDFDLELAYKDIQPEDIELLTRELNLKETTPTTLDALVQSFGRDGWFKAFKEMRPDALIENGEGKKVPAPASIAFWAEKNGVNEIAAKGLHSKLQRVFNKPYIKDTLASEPFKAIIEQLKAGKHVVLSFGDYDNDLDYLLVSNLLTRRIREEWEKMTNHFRTSKKDEPRPLVIVLEEAHKLLNREMASQTTFSSIAREMRKYYVTLLVIDQRPSQIYDEVMSQLGTRISGWLGDEEDISAVLSGLAGRDALRGMLTRLQPAEEVLMLGWGVPMPILVKSRRYDDQFWQDLLGAGGTKKSSEQLMNELGYGKK